MNVVILGRGKVGRALAQGLRKAGLRVSLRSARTRLRRGSVEARSVFILAVPDATIAACATLLAERVSRASVVMHCAGARGPEELAACRARGAAVAGFHPLVSFASRQKLSSLRGATFVVHGDARAARAAKALCRALDARCVVREALGARYHAAAALAANGAVALAFSAAQILQGLGFSSREASSALSGLLRTVADNLDSVGLPDALTGPVVRRDRATVARHLRALSQPSPEHARAYRRVLPLIEACAEAAWKKAAQRQR